MVESEEELKSLLMKVKEESEKVGLKLNIQTKIMASGPITSWGRDGETVETVSDFILGGSKITVDGWREAEAPPAGHSRALGSLHSDRLCLRCWLQLSGQTLWGSFAHLSEVPIQP